MSSFNIISLHNYRITHITEHHPLWFLYVIQLSNQLLTFYVRNFAHYFTFNGRLLSLFVISSSLFHIQTISIILFFLTKLTWTDDYLDIYFKLVGRNQETCPIALFNIQPNPFFIVKIGRQIFPLSNSEGNITWRKVSFWRGVAGKTKRWVVKKSLIGFKWLNKRTLF